MKKLLLLLLLLAGAAGVFAYWRHESQSVVEVGTVQRGRAVFAIYGTAKVLPVTSFTVRTRTAGFLKYSPRLAATNNLLGLTVTNGEFLGEVVNETLDRDFTKAAAELSAAQQKEKLGPAGIPALKTQEALTARMRKLAAQNNIPPSDLEHAENDLTTARELVRQQEIEIARASSVAKQEYADLEERKARCRFISPFDGIINGTSGVNGEYLPEGSAPFVLNSKANYIEAEVNEDDIGHVAPQMKATVKLYALPGQELPATVTKTTLSATNQHSLVNLTFDAPPEMLKAGQAGELNIISGVRERALLIPARALVGEKVWIVNHATVEPRTVKTGFRNFERVEILEGLQEGETVVLADQDLLTPGERVRLSDAKR